MPLLLTGCLLTPGKFTAEMVIQKDAGFSFAYRGEIQMLGLSQLIEMGKALDDADDVFVPAPCYGEPASIGASVIDAAILVQDDYGERECTQEELDYQRDEWDRAKQEKSKEDARNLEMVKALLGGIDPTSPAAVEELTARISRQKGWENITHKGNGVFDVEYSIAGRIDQDFAFPVLERTQGLSPFIIAVARKNGAVRIDAPGFAPPANAGGFGGMMSLFQVIGAAAMSDKDNKSGENPFANLPQPDGVFTIRTDGNILSNNTEDGPASDGEMQVLTWTINARTGQAPLAMIGTL